MVAAVRARIGRTVAAPSTSARTGTASDPTALRVRLDAGPEFQERAEWVLEALLARAGVSSWIRVASDEFADLTWGARSGGPAATIALPHDPAAWDFTWDREPDADVDPIAATFWWLARVEERLAPPTAFDEHGRFRHDQSALARRGAPLAAPVDEFARSLDLDAWAVRDPRAPAYRMVVTHDIDVPWRWTRSGRRRAVRLLRDELRAGRVPGAARTLASLLAMTAWRLRGDDPWCNAHRIARLERRAGARSTSYLLAARHAPEDGDAELHDRGMARYRDRLLAAAAGDMELLGLHGSYTASAVEGRLQAERAALREAGAGDVTDHRFHYLRHRPDLAWPMLEQAGIASDSSLGYAELPALRAGTAHPFRAWDHAADRPLDLVVVPLVVMDASFDARYLDQRGRTAMRTIDAAIDRIAQLGGSASLLVHNDRLSAGAADPWTRRYRRILRRVERDGGIACTAGTATAAYRDLIPQWRLRDGSSPR